MDENDDPNVDDNLSVERDWLPLVLRFSGGGGFSILPGGYPSLEYEIEPEDAACYVRMGKEGDMFCKLNGLVGHRFLGAYLGRAVSTPTSLRAESPAAAGWVESLGFSRSIDEWTIFICEFEGGNWLEFRGDDDYAFLYGYYELSDTVPTCDMIECCRGPPSPPK